MSNAQAETQPLHTPLAQGMICPDGAYDLHGSTSERCPECGQDLGLLHRNQPLIL